MTKKFLPGDKVYVQQQAAPKDGYPHGLARVAFKHPNLDEYTVTIERSGYRCAWYPAKVIHLINRKGAGFSMLPAAAHVKIKMQGAAKKVELFHWLLSRLDPDWPWRPENGYTPQKFCGKCNGAIYDNPNFSADDVRAMAKQIDGMIRISGALKVDLKKFNVQARYTKESEPIVVAGA